MNRRRFLAALGVAPIAATVAPAAPSVAPNPGLPLLQPGTVMRVATPRSVEADFLLAARELDETLGLLLWEQAELARLGLRNSSLDTTVLALSGGAA